MSTGNSHEEMFAALSYDGYLNVTKLPDGRYAAVFNFLFTVGLVVGLHPDGSYHHRYCYPCSGPTSIEDVKQYLAQWDGAGDPPGPWIKRKGQGGEYLNPNF